MVLMGVIVPQRSNIQSNTALAIGGCVLMSGYRVAQQLPEQCAQQLHGAVDECGCSKPARKGGELHLPWI